MKPKKLVPIADDMEYYSDEQPELTDEEISGKTAAQARASLSVACGKNDCKPVKESRKEGKP